MIENKKIFVTGASGFIGSNLCEKLVEKNKIIGFDSGRRDALKFTSLKEHPNFTLIKGDILDKELVEKSMHGCDIVIHLAAVAGVSSYYDQPNKTMEVNFIGTYNVIEAASKLPNLEKFINFSTSETYGPSVFEAKEEQPTTQGPVGEFRWTYSVSKLAAEHLCFANKYKLPMISLRPFNIYGPGQVGEGAIAIFIKKALKNEEIVITDKGTQIRAWCYISDMIDATLLALEKEEAIGNVFNIGNPSETHTILSLAKKIIEITNSSSKISFKPHMGVDVQLRVPNVDKAAKLLGYTSKVDICEGIRRSIKWYSRVEL